MEGSRRVTRILLKFYLWYRVFRDGHKKSCRQECREWGSRGRCTGRGKRRTRLEKEKYTDGPVGNRTTRGRVRKGSNLRGGVSPAGLESQISSKIIRRRGTGPTKTETPTVIDSGRKPVFEVTLEPDEPSFDVGSYCEPCVIQSS